MNVTRNIFRVGLYLLVGVVISYTVAWALEPSWFNDRWNALDRVAPVPEPIPESWPLRLPSRFTPPENMDIEWTSESFTARGSKFIRIYASGERFDWPRSEVWQFSFDELQTGVPFRCVRRFYFSAMGDGIDDWGPWDVWNRGLRFSTYVIVDLSVRPLVLGLAANSAIYGGAAWTLVWGLRRLIARRRTAHGTCPSCGYPQGVSPVCTECGSPRGPG
jgi:hypothetical protein